LLDFGSFR